MWTYSNLFPCPPPSPDLFKLVHYVVHTSVSKRAIGIRLKGLLVFNFKYLAVSVERERRLVQNGKLCVAINCSQVMYDDHHGGS